MSSRTDRTLTDAEINHLRRLLGYVQCEIGPSPEEHIAIARDLANKGLRPDRAGIAKIAEHHQKLASVPQYVRAAVRALGKTVRRCDAKDAPAAEEVGPAGLPGPADAAAQGAECRREGVTAPAATA